MKRKSKYLWAEFVQELRLQTFAEKQWFVLTFVLLILYVTLINYLQSIFQVDGSLGISYICLFLTLPLIILVCTCGVLLFGKLQICHDDIHSKVETIKFTLLVFASTFFIFLIWQIGYWPGAWSSDSIDQYTQIMTGEYNNWHPVLHTWLFFWLPYQVLKTPAGIVFAQILLFSVAVTYLYYVLYKYRCSKVFLFLTWFYIISNPNTTFIMMYPWKDNALTIFALIIFTQIIEIYETQGNWLKKWYNTGLFTIMCFLAIGVRHNAILLIAPILVILFIFLKGIRKAIIISAVSVSISVAVFNGPVMDILNVKAPEYRQVETLGLPMTILSSVYMENREALSDDAIAFMSKLATEEDWSNFHVIGNFNNLKWNSSLPLRDVIESEGAVNILSYTLDACINDPKHSINAFKELTKMVWCTNDKSGWRIAMGIANNNYNIAYSGILPIRRLLSFFSGMFQHSHYGYTTNHIGIIIMTMLFAAVSHVGNGKLGRAFIILSPLAYNFGTMLLLTGPDFRFFHFNFVIIVPILFLLQVREKEENDKTFIE